ncbi:putative fimbrial subunit [Buttiauxella brennerae ATCC 51605]|jgi:spore coat protein U-like protein|uniref:Putative fimbrial subunit n=1 Tax=Buttiauxella brennerae ATCC 51605 TaxID=1354251 RepID=A0A1B7IR38_9ENTR|nr:spore coat protein U domain-containing protein [Buttiauxella brennerae]OAT32194.1 putative fimbrial subunit [Buttiauxella brennerae ATCC 51605]
MKTHTLLLLCGSGLLCGISGAQAVVTSSGTITATLVLTNGCLINGSPSQDGINFGTLNFGEHPATFSTLTTVLSGAAGGNSFSIQCTSGAPYTVQVSGSTNAAPGTTVGTPGTPARYLVNTTDATQGVAYSIYSDTAFNNVIANNAAVPKASTTAGVDNYIVYGRIVGGGNSVTVKPGTYSDIINVSVTY